MSVVYTARAEYGAKFSCISVEVEPHGADHKTLDLRLTESIRWSCSANSRYMTHLRRRNSFRQKKYPMFSRSSWLHLRIPFSVFLLPIFLFALSVSDNLTGERVFWSFFIIHFLLYPASNGYNSYFDKDTKSIGGLKHPPPVKRGLYSLALLLDSAAIVVGYLKINTSFAAMLLVYGLVSKAYSHPAISLKKYAWTSWIVTGLLQGLFTFIR